MQLRQKTYISTYGWACCFEPNGSWLSWARSGHDSAVLEVVTISNVIAHMWQLFQQGCLN